MFDIEKISQYQAPKDALKDKVILITGAGAGIGRNAALECAAHGATVILVGRTLGHLEAVYDEIEANNYPQPAIFAMDFATASEQDYQALADAIGSEFESLDGLLNNAAILGPRKPLESYPVDQWQKVLQVNVTAPFILTKKLLPLLKKSKQASIVFTSSGLAQKGKAFWGAYSVSKSATENLMQVFADEVDGVSNIRVNAINPGATRTDMRASAFPAEDPATLKSTDEIMQPYLFLMGDESKHINQSLLSL